MRYSVYLVIDVDARSGIEARDKVQALADTLNRKDHNNKAWIPKVKEKKGEDYE